MVITGFSLLTEVCVYMRVYVHTFMRCVCPGLTCIDVYTGLILERDLPLFTLVDSMLLPHNFNKMTLNQRGIDSELTSVPSVCGLSMTSCGSKGSPPKKACSLYNAA